MVRVKKTKSIMHKDAHGNRIEIKSGRVNLYLREHKPRLIGVIDDNTKTLLVKRTREEHLMRANNSYGFCHYVLENAKRFNTVWLRDNYGEFVIPVEFILKHGTFLHFKEKNFELQIFLHINYLELHKQITHDAKRNIEQL